MVVQKVFRTVRALSGLDWIGCVQYQEHKPQYHQVFVLSPMAASSLHHLDDYKRYGRQMILDGIGLPGALALARIHSIIINDRMTPRVNAAPPQVSLSSSRRQLSSLVPED
jgi:hypothetical protein